VLRVCSCQGAAALAQHGSRGSGTLSAVSGFTPRNSSNASAKGPSPPVANQGYKMSLRLRFSHPPTFPLLEVGLFYIRQTVRSTALLDDPEMLSCMLSYLMATNLHRKAILVN
jgi:hypothetical protein